MRILVGFFVASWIAFAPPKVILDRPVPEYSTYGQLKKTLSQSFTFTWKRVDLRDILRTFSSEFEISILLDRRIDPDQLTGGELKDVSLLQGIESITRKANARVMQVSNTLYIVPATSAGNVEAIIEQRKNELLNLLRGGQVSRLRSGRLTRRKTVHWNDLGTPREIVRNIAEEYDLEVKGLDRVPHDLWAGATLPEISSYEALSLVLNQYDLTFKWNGDASSVEVVPLPKD